LYLQNCARCHGADGKAQTALGKRLQADDLTASSASTARIIRTITNGRGDMPSFKRSFDCTDRVAGGICKVALGDQGEREMKKILFLVFVALAFSLQAFAHEAFTLVSSEKKALRRRILPHWKKDKRSAKKIKRH